MQPQLWQRRDHENQALHHPQVRLFLPISIFLLMHINMPVHTLAASLSLIASAHCELLNTHTVFFSPPLWIKLIVRFMGTDCILILKECLEVTRTWACLTSKAHCREGPFNVKRTSFSWVLPFGCWRGSDGGANIFYLPPFFFRLRRLFRSGLAAHVSGFLTYNLLKIRSSAHF